MTISNYYRLKRLYPNASDEDLWMLQREQFIDEVLAKRQAKQQAEEEGKEAARAFTAAFEKELEKLFK